jgi:DNA-binding transcriptional regulator YiaG
MVALAGLFVRAIANLPSRDRQGNNAFPCNNAAMEFAAWSEAGSMAKKKRHSRAEIATRLAQANELVTQGKLQSEVARTLGVSVMTLQRWRNAQPAYEASQPPRTRGWRDRIAELRLENLRLRQLVTDLLLEKIRLEEAAQGSKIFLA